MPALFVAALALSFLSPTVALAQERPAVDVEAEWAAIRAANQRFVRAERSGSLDSIAAAMWADAVLLPPRRLEVRGHEAILAFRTPGSPPGRSSQPTSGRETVISASGDMAVVRGIGGPTARPYKFVSVVEKRAGEWKLLLNTWNPSPAPTPEEVGGAGSDLIPAQRPLSVEAEAERAAVDAANSRFGRAERSGSLDSIAAAVWPDAVILPPGGRWALQGREEIFAFLTPDLTPDSAKAYTPYRARLLSAGGDMAVLSGPGCWEEQGPDGPIPHHIKFVNVLEKRDGAWKVLMNLWNEPAALNSGSRCESG